jgi:hypothetical protein
MSDDGDDADNELGRVGEQVDGIANRFGKSESSETIDMSETTEAAKTTETTGMSETAKTTETSDVPGPGDDGFQLREHWNGRTIYLPDDAVDDLDLRYKECSIKWQQQHGGELAKNEQFYPAVIRAALEETSIEAQLNLD